MEAIGAHPGLCQRTRVQNQPRPPELLQSARREDREETRQVDDRLGRGARAPARFRYRHSILARAAVARRCPAEGLPPYPVIWILSRPPEAGSVQLRYDRH